jgi:hypothetical protein
MAKTSIKYGHLNELYFELGGMTDSKSGEVFMEGILKQKLKFKTKFFLTQLLEKVNTEKEKVDKAVKDLMEKFGEYTEDGTSIVIPEKIEEGGEMIPNPKLIEFNKEISDFLNSTLEIEHGQINIEDFEGMETDENYPILFKFIED